MKVQHDELLSSYVDNVNLRRYHKGLVMANYVVIGYLLHAVVHHRRSSTKWED